jgi:benzoyl-CoA reductase/2-hydroxyglutaryl-CoA dehydratase subunit BcrC/BadD/HgdB
MNENAIGYFEKIVTTDRRLVELQRFPGKMVGVYCNFVPEALIHALGAVPVRLCSGDREAARRGEELFPRDTCSLVKACVGNAIRGDGLFAGLDLLVIPTPCDAKKKLGAVLSAFKPVHILQLPPSKTTPAAVQFWMDQVWELVHRLEALTGRTLTREALEQAVLLANSASASPPPSPAKKRSPSPSPPSPMTSPDGRRSLRRCAPSAKRARQSQCASRGCSSPGRR